MDTDILDQNYNFIVNEFEYSQDEFDKIVDRLFVMHKNSQISKKDLKFLLKLTCYFKFKKEIMEEKKNIKNGFLTNKKFIRNTDTLSINFINKKADYASI